MKIIPTHIMKQWDLFTIEQEPIESWALMERAAHIFFQKMIHLTPLNQKFGIICGTGNNGGDGLVVARLLLNRKADVQVFIVGDQEKASPDFKRNIEKLPSSIISIFSSQTFTDFDILIDGIFGYGLSRKPEGVYAKAICQINQSKATVFSIDTPSGLFPDEWAQQWPDDIVKAHYTFTFQAPFPAFFSDENMIYIGEWDALNIGLQKGFSKLTEVNDYWVTAHHVSSLLPQRLPTGDKRKNGNVLVAGGSKGMAGAVQLCATAALKSGAGLCEVRSVELNREIIQKSLPEAIWSTSNDQEYLENSFEIKPKHTALAVGSGLGTYTKTHNLLLHLLKSCKIPSVWDADALNIIAQNKWLNYLPENSIITPHNREFERLFNSPDIERKEQIAFSKKHQVIILRKGANTCITTPSGERYFINSGTSALAKGGSGDVLTGIIAGFLAQGITPKNAATAAAFIHGNTARLFEKNHTQLSMLARDIIRFINAKQ